MGKLTKEEIEAVLATIEKALDGKSDEELNGMGASSPWDWRKQWNAAAFAKDPVAYIENHAPPLLVPAELERWAKFAPPGAEKSILDSARFRRKQLLAFLAEWPECPDTIGLRDIMTNVYWVDYDDFDKVREEMRAKVNQLRRQQTQKIKFNF